MKYNLGVVATLLSLCSVLRCANAEQVRSFHVGNSLTNQTLVHVGAELVSLAQLRGIAPVVGSHIRCGSQLNQILANPTDTCVAPSPQFGYFGNALPNFTWDAVTFQPYGDSLPNARAASGSLINLAKQNPANASTDFYVMSMWPQGESSDSFSTRFNRAYNETVDDPESRWSSGYATTVLQHVRDDFPLTRIGMVMSGEVLNQFDLLARAGQITGYTKADELYGDPYHLSPAGSYLSRLALFATMYHTSPAGLPVPSNANLAAEDVLDLQKMVWETVTQNWDKSLVIAADADCNGRVDSSDFNVLAGHFGAATYLNSQGDFNGSGAVDSLDFAVFMSQYGVAVGPASATGSMVPEPGSVMVLPLAAASLSRRRLLWRHRTDISHFAEKLS